MTDGNSYQSNNPKKHRCTLNYSGVMILYTQFRNYQSRLSFKTEKNDVVHNINYFIVTKLMNYQGKFPFRVYLFAPPKVWINHGIILKLKIYIK